ncbi:MAG: sulfatase [Rikenellaceae bacterium]|jgi:arylsulfatase A-like enzyme|nr:sulfatase [Rikenellaceae bacterium]
MKKVITISSALPTALAMPATLLPAALAAQAPKPQAEKRYNIIHIMTDDHSYQTISAYGGRFAKIAPTPNIDRLAREGMIFMRGYVENSISTPSRAALITGKYSHINGQTTLSGGYIPDQPCFPQMLQAAGYQTAVVGKWHIKVDPYGFDYWKVLREQGHYYNPQFKSSNSGGEYVQQVGYATEIITSDALTWLDGRDRSKPFCLLLHHKAPHRNWMPGPGYLNLYEDVTMPEPANLFDDYHTRGSAAHTQDMSVEHTMTLGADLKVAQLQDDKNNNLSDEFARMTVEQRAAWDAVYGPRNEAFLAANLAGRELVRWKYQSYIKDYLRIIKSVDDQIGRVLDYLDRNGLTQNTLVVYTSDQGFYMGEHGWFDKRFMYEESFRTPIIARLPGVVKAGSRCEALVQNIDFAPTYLDMAGAVVPSDMCGVSWRPLFARAGAAPAGWRDELYYHYYDYPAVHMVRKHDGVSTRDYKLIHFYGPGEGKGRDLDEWELYDLRRDPSEMRNVYSDPRYAAIVADLRARLDAQRKKNGVTEY